MSSTATPEPQAAETSPAGAAPAFKPKKSVALSGTPAGNTALCTVGRERERAALSGVSTSSILRRRACMKRSLTC